MRKCFTPIVFLTLALWGCSNNYKQNLKVAYTQAKVLKESSTLVAEQIAATWNSAIFNHQYSFGSHSGYVSDFNDALVKLMQEPEIIQVNKSIDSLRSILKVSMEKLTDPPTKYKDTYNDLVTLYSSLSELSNMATNPSGSLQTYRQNLNDLTSKVNSTFSEIEVRNPGIEQKK
jgi:hypothetical protein